MNRWRPPWSSADPRRRAPRRHAGRAETRPAGKVRPGCPRHRRSASGTRRETGSWPGALRPGRSHKKLLFNIPATFAEFEADLSRRRTREGMPSPASGGNCAASSPNSPTDSSGNSAACTPPASIPSAISLSSSPSQDQPSIAHSTGVIPLSVRSCPLPESTRDLSDKSLLGQAQKWMRVSIMQASPNCVLARSL